MKSGMRLVYGVGFNDAYYPVNKYVNRKKVWTCPFYRKWSSMLQRCYSQKFQNRHPTYIGCIVCDEWLVFSNFKVWMQQQDWQGKELDKDLLFAGNKIYSPVTCCFVDAMTNTFMNDSAANRGNCIIGVHWDSNAGKFRAYCCNPFTGLQERLGYYHTEQEAHHSWKRRKRDLALQLASLQDDKRVVKLLSEKYI